MSDDLCNEHDSCEFDAEEHYQLAVAAYQQGESKPAAYFISCALVSDPNSKDLLELLDKIIADSEDPISISPLCEDKHFNTVAVHCYILARTGRLEEALKILFEVVSVRPSIPYLSWVISWLENPEHAATVQPLTISGCLSFIIKGIEDPEINRHEQWHEANISCVIWLIRKYQKIYPEDVTFLSFSTMVMRRLGHLDEALALAERAYKLKADYGSAIALAGVYREKGDIEGTVRLFKVALTEQPDDIAVRLDIGDVLMENNRLEESLHWYQQVLEREPEHPWALPSTYFINYLLHEDEGYRDRLQALAEASPDNQRAYRLAAHLSPYVWSLPEAEDATINILRKLIYQLAEGEDLNEGGTVNISLSHLEAPSTRIAFDLQMYMMSANIELDVKVEKIQQPDPRVARAQTDYLLWEYEHTEPKLAIAPPSEEVAEAVSQIAAQNYRLSTWYQQAGQLARKLGPANVEQLLAVMVYPPLPPFPIPSWIWMQHLQVAAALTIAQIDSGWDQSVRKRALTAVALGPLDWTIEAAIIALTEVARTTPEALMDVVAIFDQLFDEIPNEGYCCYQRALIENYLRLPQLPEEIKKTLLELRRNYYQSSDN